VILPPFSIPCSKYGQKTVSRIRVVYFKFGRQFAASYKAAYFQQAWTCCIPFTIQLRKVISPNESVYDPDSLLAVTNGSCC
jgi:hypothetical protein